MTRAERKHGVKGEVFVRRLRIGGLVLLAVLVGTATVADDTMVRVVEVEGRMERASGPAGLLGLVAEDEVTVRALRAFGRLPEPYVELAQSLRREGIDLLAMDTRELHDLLVPAGVGKVQVDPDLVAQLLGLLEGRDYLDWEPLSEGDTLAFGDLDLLRGDGRMVVEWASGETAVLGSSEHVRPGADELKVEPRLSAETEALIREIQGVDQLRPLRSLAQRIEREHGGSLADEEMQFVRAAITAQRAAIATAALEELAEADASLRLLSFYLALGEGDVAEASRHAFQLTGSARGLARTAASALETLSETEVTAEVGQAVATRIPTLRRELRAALVQEIEGMQAGSLDRLEQRAERDYADSLGPEEMQFVAAALAERRAKIATTALETLAAIDASRHILAFYLALDEGCMVEANQRIVFGAPALQAARTIVALLQTPSEMEVAAVVGPGVSARIPAVRSELRTALVQEIEGIDAPVFQQAVGLLDRFAQRVERDYADSLGIEEMQRVQNAVAARRAALATAAATAALETLMEADASLRLLAFYLALDEGSVTEANRHAVQMHRVVGSPREPALTLTSTLDTLSETEVTAVVGPAVSARIPTVRREVRAALVQEIERAGASGDERAVGLLDRLAQRAEREYAASLGNEEMQTVAAALAEQREAVVAAALETLAAADSSLPLLSYYLALDAGALSVAGSAGRAGRLPRPAGDAARTLVAALQTTFEAEVAAVVGPAVSARIPTVRSELRAGLVQEIEAVEASAYQRALGLLDRLAQRAERDYADSLGAEEMERVVAAIAAQRAAATAAALETLAAADGSLPLLSYYLAIDAGALADANQRANRLPRPAHFAARTVVVALGTPSRAEVAAVVGPAVSARIPTLRRELREVLVGEIQGAEASVRGLQSLVRHAQRAERDYADSLGADEMQRVEAAVAARRAAIGETIRDDIGREVQAIPVSITAFRSLDEVAPPRLLTLLPAAEARKVRETVNERRQRIATELLPKFAALPETDEALLEIEEVILPELERLPASASGKRQPIERAAKARHAEILAAVTRAEAGPLAGRFYQGPLWTIEFIGESRVIVTVGSNPPAAGTYEELSDGRVIISFGGESKVFSREGARLISGPIRVHRVRPEATPKSPLTQAHPDLEWPSLSEEEWQHATAEMIKAHLDAGADPKARDEDGSTALMFAAGLNGNPEIIKMLLDAGADLEARDEIEGWTALMLAAGFNGNPQVIKTLLDAGADLEAANEDGMTALMFAAGANENPEVVRTLLDAGADLEARDEIEGWTALMLAAQFNGNPEAVAALVDRGADLEARDEEGWTALMWAANSNENPEVITTLLDAGGNVHAEALDGMTAWDALQRNDALHGTDAYWRLSAMRYE